MDDPSGDAIVEALESVRNLRLARAADTGLAARVEAVKRFQHRRFENDYADLLASDRYGAAARFFLDDLYGPADYTARDAQFARIVPALRRLLPEELLLVVSWLVELHALSEELDQQMAGCIAGPVPLELSGYRAAWRQVGRRPDRLRQVDLTLAVGRALDRHTRKPLLPLTLRLMHGPAHAAGLGELQSFLQRGLTAFRAMHGAEPFLARVGQHERALIDRLFDTPERA